MCLFGGSKTKLPDPAPVNVPKPPPPPEKSPEAPSLDVLGEKGNRRKTVRNAQGTSALKIDLNVPGSSPGATGLNI